MVASTLLAVLLSVSGAAVQGRIADEKHPNVKLIVVEEDPAYAVEREAARLSEDGGVGEGSLLSTEEAAWDTAQVTWTGKRVRDLHKEYRHIFATGNRNAASHKWATFLMQRSASLSAAKLAEMFSGFCAVSGSPVHPSQYTRYKLTLDAVPAAAAAAGSDRERNRHEG